MCLQCGRQHFGVLLSEGSIWSVSYLQCGRTFGVLLSEESIVSLAFDCLRAVLLVDNLWSRLVVSSMGDLLLFKVIVYHLKALTQYYSVQQIDDC